MKIQVAKVYMKKTLMMHCDFLYLCKKTVFSFTREISFIFGRVKEQKKNDIVRVNSKL